MGMTTSYGYPADEAEAIKVIHRALDLGVNFFDTAESYGPFKNEELLGKALKQKKNEALVATKFGFTFEDGQLVGTNSRPEHVKKVADASLMRLGRDVIDLFYQHRVDKQIPIEETVGAMSELVKAGKVRYLGLSEAGLETIKRADKVHKITALQSEYSLWERGLESTIIPLLKELNIGLVPFSPVGRGFLTGTIKTFDDLPANDYRRSDPRYQGNNFQKNIELVEAIKKIAAKYNATPAQIAIAWVLMQDNDFVPIPGTKRIKYLEENIASADIILDKNDLSQLDELAQKISGERYNEERMAWVER
jgi:aryl-alcohol dehydrogenase-like predicted oxidoreductase